MQANVFPLQLNSSCKAVFLSIYRPSRYCAMCYVAKQLSVIFIDFDCVVIISDLHIHVHIPLDSSSKELCCVLDNYGLTQHVPVITHNNWHTQDLIIPHI